MCTGSFILFFGSFQLSEVLFRKEIVLDLWTCDTESIAAYFEIQDNTAFHISYCRPKDNWPFV